MNKELRIVFLGTPDFAVATLDALIKNKLNVVGVITSLDKPAGRGQQIQMSAVKQYAVQHGLKVLQPEKLKNETFIQELKALQADVQVIVAFRMLPEIIWNMPPLGTINLHASLLPQYRGAAPINWAVINGEKKSGVTTFKLQQEIDTGDIIYSEEVEIGSNMTAGELHDELMIIGATLMLKTINDLSKGTCVEVPQNKLTDNVELKHAPKLFKETCAINWNQDIQKIYDFIRGLSPYPTAHTNLVNSNGEKFGLKIFKTSIIDNVSCKNGLNTDGKSFLNYTHDSKSLVIHELQLASKKRMSVVELLNGFKIDSNWSFES